MLPAFAGNEVVQFVDLGTALIFELNDFAAHGFLEDPRAVTERPLDQFRISFAVLDDLLLNVVVNAAFLGAYQALPHVDAVRPKASAATRPHASPKSPGAINTNRFRLDCVTY